MHSHCTNLTVDVAVSGGYHRSIGVRMPDWIANANVEHFKKLLKSESDPAKRRVIERELAEEEQKLAALKKQAERKEG